MKKFCAHRGLSELTPENTLPSFAASLALGADEIEFDVRLTSDKKLVVSHDDKLERISDGHGRVSESTLDYLLSCNVGIDKGWTVSFCTPEEVFEQFANKMTFNIHLKEHGEDGFLVKRLAELINKYNAQESVYFAASPDELYWLRRLAPDIPRTAIQLPDDEIGIYEMAKKYDCTRVQLWRDMFDEELISRLHFDGISCNMFWADTVEDYDKYFSLGIDTLLTNRMDIAADYKKRLNL